MGADEDSKTRKRLKREDAAEAKSKKKSKKDKVDKDSKKSKYVSRVTCHANLAAFTSTCRPKRVLDLVQCDFCTPCLPAHRQRCQYHQHTQCHVSTLMPPVRFACCGVRDA